MLHPREAPELSRGMAAVRRYEVILNGEPVTDRFVGRNGWRARISVEAWARGDYQNKSSSLGRSM